MVWILHRGFNVVVLCHTGPVRLRATLAHLKLQPSPGNDKDDDQDSRSVPHAKKCWLASFAGSISGRESNYQPDWSCCMQRYKSWDFSSITSSMIYIANWCWYCCCCWCAHSSAERGANPKGTRKIVILNNLIWIADSCQRSVSSHR